MANERILIMKYNFLWLTLRLMKKQKLRTLTIFCGTFFSSFLLSSFGSLGYNFWNQVHDGNSEASTFDSTQWILIALVLILLGLVILCSAVLTYNLLSLTFIQKWRSMGGLITLGADSSNLVFMTITELVIIFCFAAPLGQIVLIIVALMTASMAATIVNWGLMRKENFLQDIRNFR